MGKRILVFLLIVTSVLFAAAAAGVHGGWFIVHVSWKLIKVVKLTDKKINYGALTFTAYNQKGDPIGDATGLPDSIRSDGQAALGLSITVSILSFAIACALIWRKFTIKYVRPRLLLLLTLIDTGLAISAWAVFMGGVAKYIESRAFKDLIAKIFNVALHDIVSFNRKLLPSWACALSITGCGLCCIAFLFHLCYCRRERRQFHRDLKAMQYGSEVVVNESGVEVVVDETSLINKSPNPLVKAPSHPEKLIKSALYVQLFLEFLVLGFSVALLTMGAICSSYNGCILMPSESVATLVGGLVLFLSFCFLIERAKKVHRCNQTLSEQGNTLDHSDRGLHLQYGIGGISICLSIAVITMGGICVSYSNHECVLTPAESSAVLAGGIILCLGVCAFFFIANSEARKATQPKKHNQENTTQLLNSTNVRSSDSE